MAKFLQRLPTAPTSSPMNRLVALLSYLHFATLQVSQHHTHHIGRIVQPQIRSLSAALQGEAPAVMTKKLADGVTRPKQNQNQDPRTT